METLFCLFIGFVISVIMMGICIYFIDKLL